MNTISFWTTTKGLKILQTHCLTFETNFALIKSSDNEDDDEFKDLNEQDSEEDPVTKVGIHFFSFFFTTLF